MNPVSDGDACNRCDQFVDYAYVLVSSNDQGLVKFSGASSGTGVGRAWLSLNLYGGPVYERDINIYGIGSASDQLAMSELGAGSLLGTLRIPASTAIGEEVLFDVTRFVRDTSDPFLAFTLQSAGSGYYVAFSSLEYNHGQPAQLILTQVPEPGAGALMFAGLIGLAAWLRRRAAG